MQLIIIVVTFIIFGQFPAILPHHLFYTNRLWSIIFSHKKRPASGPF